MSESDGRGVLDTSVVIALPGLQDHALLPPLPLLTTVTLAELSVGPLVADSDAIRSERQGNLQLAEGNFESLPFDVAAARAFGQVAACLRRAGRKAHARSFDAMIAAIAIANGLPLYTCNPGDFEGIDELEVVGVPQP
jgi:tRNA(fMet)-specific endonuclease VapC